jgi:hypothetical protein
MRPHEERVVEEKAELDKKIAALKAFIEVDGRFGTLPRDECQRLRDQYAVMLDYSRILSSRIAAFPPTKE